MLSRTILKRRELLLGLGSASFLAAPVFRETLAEAQASPILPRFIPIYMPACEATGKFSFANALAPLLPFESDSIVFTGINNAAAAAIWGVTSEPHGAELRTLLTGDSSIKPRENASVWADSDSIDQIIAQRISSELKFTTLQFGVVSETRSNPLDQRRMIFKGGTPQPPIQDPGEMFTRLFGTGIPSASSTGTTSTASAADTVARGKSVLDRMILEVTALKAVAGVGEQQKLDQHLTSLRELEKQVIGGKPAGDYGIPGATAGPSCAAPTLAPVPYAQSYPPGSGPGPDIPGVTSQQFELLYQAINCDLTRVASMQLLGTAHTEVTFDWLGVKDDHHALEHGGVLSVGMEKVQMFFAAEVAKFLNRLKATPEGSGNMLDNSLVFFFTDFSNGESHSHLSIPFHTFGKAGGKVTAGRTIAYSGTPHNLLLRSVLNVFGLDQAAVGDEVGGTPIALS